jgi:hypothetical protein
MWRFPVSSWQFQIPILFTAVKKRLILIYKAEETLIWMSSMSESYQCNLFLKKVKNWYSTTWFRIWQFQTPDSKRYLHCISWLNGSFLGMMIEVFWTRESKPLWWHQRLPQNSPTFFSFDVYSLWVDHGTGVKTIERRKKKDPTVNCCSCLFNVDHCDLQLRAEGSRHPRHSPEQFTTRAVYREEARYLTDSRCSVSSDILGRLPR